MARVLAGHEPGQYSATATWAMSISIASCQVKGAPIGICAAVSPTYSRIRVRSQESVRTVAGGCSSVVQVMEDGGMTRRSFLRGNRDRLLRRNP
jgi:hypothetical protein